MKIKKLFKKLKGTDTVPELTLSFKQSLLQKKSLDSPQDRVEFLRKLFDSGTFELQEELILVPLDSYDRPITFYKMGKGTLAQVGIEDGVLYPVLLGLGAKKFFLAHNHPSKVVFPSYSDIESAHTIRMKADKIDVEMVDDIVIGSLTEGNEEDGPGYYSLDEQCLLYA